MLIVVALSMAVTPVLLLLNEKLFMPMFEKASNEERADIIEDEETPVVIAGFGRFGVVIGRMLIANGFSATILDNNPDNISVLRKFGFKVYYGDATRHDLLHAAGCKDARVLVVAIDDMDKALQIVDYARKEFPHLEIVARAIHKKHAYEYLRRGISDYELETFNSSLHVGIRTLVKLGFDPYHAQRAARIFRHHNKAIEKELFQHYDEDESKYLSETMRFSRELEDLLQSEKERSIHEFDTAWDDTSRREEFAHKNSGQDDS